MTDDELLDELRRMWTELDPVPAGLVDDVLAAVATDGVDLELFVLVAEPAAAIRAAGDPPEAVALRFSRHGLELLVRITVDGERRRLDGWLAPGGPGTVVLRGERAERSAPVGPTGRFEFPDVPPGPAVLEVQLPSGVPRGRRVATPTFDL